MKYFACLLISLSCLVFADDLKNQSCDQKNEVDKSGLETNIFKDNDLLAGHYCDRNSHSEGKDTEIQKGEEIINLENFINSLHRL